MKIQHVPEQVGRTYTTEHYAVHSRRVGGDNGWSGASRYKTVAEAQKAIEATSARSMEVGGINIVLTGNREQFQYRIVKVVSACEVVATEFRMV